MRRAIAIIGLAGLIAGWGVASRDAAPDLSAGSARLVSATSLLDVTGTVQGLIPGVPRALTVRVANRRRYDIELRSIAVTAGQASDDCLAGRLALGGYRGRLQIRARRAKSLRVPIQLLPGAPEACQAAIFPLHYRARAVRP
jgi:hypothetical protein